MTRALATIACLGLVACGTTDDADQGVTGDSAVPAPTTAVSTTRPTIENVENVENVDAEGESTDDSIPESDPSTSDQAPSPLPTGLVDAVLPSDTDRVVALFEALPDRLFDADKELVADRPGEVRADYALPGRTTPVGFQAIDVTRFADYLPGPTAEHFVAMLTIGDDPEVEVEGAGQDDDLHWVVWNTSGSGYGIDGVELISVATFGATGGGWAFVVSGVDSAQREILLAAFVDTVRELPEPVPLTPDEEAARAAVLTGDDLDGDWLARVDLSSGDEFHAMALAVLAQEPECAEPVAWLSNEELTLSGLFDVVGAGSITRGESPTLLGLRDHPLEVKHVVMVFESADAAAAAFDTASEVGWIDCVVAALPELTAPMYAGPFPGVTVDAGAADIRTLEIGDRSIAAHFELTLDVPGDDAPLGAVQDIAIVVEGRVISAVVVYTLGGALADAEITALLTTATGKMAGAFGSL